MIKKIFEDEEEMENKSEPVMIVNMLRVKQLTRKIGPVFVPNQIDSIEMVDSELGAYINDGWKLHSVTRLATEPEGFTFLYILTKD